MSDSVPFDPSPTMPRSDHFEEMRARAALAEAARPLNKATLFDALAAAGITRVVVEFDGAGDSGQIESVLAYAGQRAVDLPVMDLVLSEPSPSGSGLDRQTCPIAEVIETMAYDVLAEAHAGWEDNDGAFGAFTFDVADRSILLTFNARFTDSVLTEHAY